RFVISGLLVSQTDDAVTLKTSEGIERRVPRGDVAQLSRQPLSLMPADLHREMTEAELIDLVEYLMTLRNGSPAAAPDPAREETSSNSDCGTPARQRLELKARCSLRKAADFGWVVIR